MRSCRSSPHANSAGTPNFPSSELRTLPTPSPAALSTLRTERHLGFLSPHRRAWHSGRRSTRYTPIRWASSTADIKPANLLVECSHLAPRDGAFRYSTNKTGMFHHRGA